MNDRFLEDLKNRIDIVEVIRKYAELKKSGKNYMGRSPFRNERTPSFCVSPDKQFWYDFGTSEGGDVISFLERIESLSFPEAVEHLADMAGVELPKESFQKSGPSKEVKKDIFMLHQKAARFFQEQLEKNKEAQKYLKERGISDEVCKEWRLGYGGDIADGLTKYLLQSGFAQKQISESGVAFEREFGAKTMRDRFLRRLMIPICEPKEGKIVAFTGRDLSGEKKVAKYINSPENPVYHKSSTLFGFDRARKVIREKDAVILVEGNFDVISAHTAGFRNTVATCGTSLTEDHLRILKRLTKNFYLAFDTDVAGKKATLRAVEMVLKMELNPFIIEVKGKKDLDELAQENPKELQKVVKNAHNAVLFLLEKFTLKNLDGSIEGEKKFLDSMFYFLKLVSRPVEVDEMINTMALRLNRAKSIIEEEFQRYKAKHIQPVQRRHEKVSRQKFSREEAFVGFLCANWDFFGGKLNDKILDLVSGECKDLLERKFQQKDFTSEEQKKLLGWQLHQELLYGDTPSPDILKRDFLTFTKQLEQEHAKQTRVVEARKVRSQL